MTYKVVKKYNGTIIGRTAEKKKDKDYKGGSYTFESNGNGCDSVTLSGSLVQSLPDYFKKVKE